VSEDDSALPLPRTRSWLMACLLVSGASALMYQVVWLRALELLFGTTAFATATVLSAYMAGLGLGAHAFGGWIDRHARIDAVKVYGWMEGGVALYAAITPLLWRLLDAADMRFHQGVAPSPLVASLLKFALAFAALLPPTFLMGGTLPVVCKAVARSTADAGRAAGLLYGANTLGAAFGVFLSGFVVLPAAGMRAVTFAAAGFSLLVCFVALRSRSRPGAAQFAPSQRADENPRDNPRHTPVLLILFGVSGAVAMLYEVAWTRVLAVVLGSTVYAFSAMLGTFLLGIALGSWAFAVFSARHRPGLGAFAVLQIAAGVLVLVGLNQFDELPYRFVRIFAWSGGNPAAIDFGRALLCASVLLPPTLVLGAVFACFIDVSRRSASVGSRVGVAYLANTTGNIAGAVLTGFVVIPWAGVQRTLMAGALVSGLAGLVAWFLRDARSGLRTSLPAIAMAALIGVAVARVHPWDKTMLTSGMAVDPAKALPLTRSEFDGRIHEKTNLFYREGVQATVSVDRWQDDLFLSVNGKVDASTGDAFTQLFLGHLPMLLHASPSRVLVIGLGSGTSLGAVACHAADRIDCVEIEPATVEAARHFLRLNRCALDDPRVRLHAGDGRNFLRVRPDRYDVIISEPSNPWMAGVANLFSREHYRTAAARLEPGGIFCQWLHAYSMSEDDLRMIVNTFCGEFANTSLWAAQFPDLVLIGSNSAQPFDFAPVRRGFEDARVREDMARYGGIRAPEALLANFLLGDAALRALAAGAAVHTDDRPRLEFSAPRNLYRDTAETNRALLLRYRGTGDAPLRIEPPLERNAIAWSELARTFIARKSVAEAEAALARSAGIQPGNARWLEVSGILNAGLGKLDDASRQLTEAIASGAATPEAHFYLGLILRARGDAAEGERALRSALARADAEPSYLRALADCVFDQGKFIEAHGFYSRLLDVKERDAHASSRLDEIARRSGGRTSR